MSLTEFENTFELEQTRLKPILDKMIEEKIVVKRNTLYQLKEL
jgi:predicted transcriptional regulator